MACNFTHCAPKCSRLHLKTVPTHQSKTANDLATDLYRFGSVAVAVAVVSSNSSSSSGRSISLQLRAKEFSATRNSHAPQSHQSTSCGQKTTIALRVARLRKA